MKYDDMNDPTKDNGLNATLSSSPADEYIPATSPETGIEKKIIDLVSQVHKLDTGLQETKREARREKWNLLTVFGVFASIVTLFAFEVQIFKNACNVFQLIGLSLLFSANLLLFLFFLIWLTDSSDVELKRNGDFRSKRVVVLIVTLLIFVIVGLFCLVLPNSVPCKV